jgi:hypothetical protein
MSDEQLQALGLPRREFLKKAAAGVFVAPVIVSFGLAGTAEAAGAGCFPNQTIANQAARAARATSIGNIVVTVFNREHQGYIDENFAHELRKRLLEAEGDLLDGHYGGCCGLLDKVKGALINQTGKKINASVASELYTQVNTVWNNIGCNLCT